MAEGAEVAAGAEEAGVVVGGEAVWGGRGRGRGPDGRVVEVEVSSLHLPPQTCCRWWHLLWPRRRQAPWVPTPPLLSVDLQLLPLLLEPPPPRHRRHPLILAPPLAHLLLQPLLVLAAARHRRQRQACNYQALWAH